MKILIAGDTHCNVMWMYKLIDHAKYFECDSLFVLGDFGYWPLDGFGRDFLYKTHHRLKKMDIPLYFLDGNHEHHDELDKLKRNANGLVEIPSHMYFTPRGYGWEWDGVKFVALGGAVSVDQHLRKEGKDWFPQEVISDEDMNRAIINGSADVLLSHDSPACSPIEGHLYPTRGTTNEDSYENRVKVESVAKALGVTRIYHGHHHYSSRTRWLIGDKDILVESLDRDNQTGSWTVFDTEEYKKNG